MAEAAKKQEDRARALTEKAIAAFEAHELDRAAALGKKAVAAGPDPLNAARLVELLRVIGETDASEALAAETLDRLAGLAEEAADNAELLGQYGHLCMELDRPDMAEPMLLGAQELDPTEGRSAVLLLHVLLQKGDPGTLLKVWERFLNASDKPANHVILLAKALAHFEYREMAEDVMKTAEPLFRHDREVYDETIANIRGSAGTRAQGEMAARLFDQAAEVYDENLKAIGNAGPLMIARMLKEIDLAPGAGLSVLDAGCGTGLCAPYLRPYAAQVHGCDVSVKMLELCKEKQLYDLLTRTDLNVRATFPEGPFDLVVSGDVFVYFGDLSEAVKNIADVLKPGGWFVFTVEDCSDDPPTAGHLLRTSGRHAHSRSYVADTLARGGFGRPKAEFVETLRREFRSPIAGRAFAAQKLAILGSAR